MSELKISDRLDVPDPSELILATDGSYVRRIHSSGFIATNGYWGIHAANYGKDPCKGGCVDATEMRAIYLGLQTLPPKTNVTVLTDSMNSIEQIERWQDGDQEMPEWYDLRARRRTSESSLVQLRDRVAEDAEFIHTQYVKGHSGHLLNEAADSLAGIGKNVCKKLYDKPEATRRAIGIASAFLTTYTENI